MFALIPLFSDKPATAGKRNQIIGQWWRRVGNELLQARSLKRPLPGAPDVSSQLVSSLPVLSVLNSCQFLLPNHSLPSPPADTLYKASKNWEGRVDKVLGILPAGSISQVWMLILIWPPLTEWYFHPISRRRLCSRLVLFLKLWNGKKTKLPPHRRLFMLEPTRYFSGSYTVASASDERMLTSSDTQKKEYNVLTILMSSPIIIFVVLLNNRISGIKIYLRIQHSELFLDPRAPVMM